MPLNSISATSLSSQKLMEQCCRTPRVSYLPLFRMAPGVYYVSGSDWVTCYLVDTGAGLTLIDAAMHETCYLMLECIRNLGHDPMDIKRILLTHAHAGHIGVARIMEELTGVRVYPGERDLFMIHKRRDLVYNGGYTYRDIRPDRIYLDDRPITQGNVSAHTISTPGHTPGCTSMVFDVKEKDGRIYTCGIHGGIGLSTLSRGFPGWSGLPLSLQKEFRENPRVMDRFRVDICLPSCTNQVEIIPLIRGIIDTHSPSMDENIWYELMHKRLDRMETLTRPVPLL